MNDPLTNIWLRSNPYNRAQVGGRVSWLTAEQNARRERIRQAKMLFDGDHRCYFVDEARTQFKPQLVKLELGEVGKIYVPYNLLKLIALKSADLLFGEEPMIRSDELDRQDDIDAMLERSNWHRMLYQAGIECSWAGETYLEPVRWRNEVYIANAPAEEIFPMGPLQPDGQYASYRRFATANIGTAEREVWLLLETTYTAGEISRVCYQLEGGQKLKTVSLDQWPAKDETGRALPDVERTGLDVPSLVWVPNEMYRGQAVSDFDGLIELQDSLNAKNSQVAYVLLKHAAPRIAAHVDSADKNGNIPQTAEVLYFTDEKNIPRYLAYNAELTAAMEDRKFVLHAMCTLAEMSPVLLGIKEGAAPDAARKLRLEATNSLAKAQRKAAYFRPAIRRTLDLAFRMQFAGPIRMTPLTVGVQMRDGLPEDELDRAQTLATLRTAQLISRRRGLEQQGLEPAGVEKELAEIEDESAASAPSIFMQSPAPAAQTDQPTPDASTEVA